MDPSAQLDCLPTFSAMGKPRSMVAPSRVAKTFRTRFSGRTGDGATSVPCPSLVEPLIHLEDRKSSEVVTVCSESCLNCARDGLQWLVEANEVAVLEDWVVCCKSLEAVTWMWLGCVL